MSTFNIQLLCRKWKINPLIIANCFHDCTIKNLSGSKCSFLEQFSMVPKVFESLTKQTHNVIGTLQRRCNDIVATLCLLGMFDCIDMFFLCLFLNIRCSIYRNS